jgi:hypothetical protein
VADQPWVTGAETCELAIALHLVGETAAATRLVGDMQHLRHADGSYWTGWQFVDAVYWPWERSTWTAAALLLAVDTITGGVTGTVFGGDALPAGDRASSPDGAASAPVPLGCGCGSDAAFEYPQRSCA